MSDWISVEDRLPEGDDMVIYVASPYSEDGVEVGWYDSLKGWTNGLWRWESDLATDLIDAGVTHWQPLPPPPPHARHGRKEKTNAND